jgi:hypothetical protein
LVFPKQENDIERGAAGMDCVVPGPSVRLFCSALSALGKVGGGTGGGGGDLYWEHDAASGLTLRALNGARSAFCSARFRPAFFDRCTTVPSAGFDGGEGDGGGASSTARPHLSVRIAMRALGPVVRPRRDVVQLRITAVFAAAAAAAAVPSPSPSRKRKKCLRGTGEGGRPVLRIAFEFLVAAKGGGGGGGGGSSRSPEGSPVLLRAAHCVPVSASRVEPVAAVAPRAGASELACPPRSLLRLLEPLRSLRAAEVALLVHRDATALAAQSFHPSDRCHFLPADPSQEGGGGVQLVLRQPEHGHSHQGSRAARTEASMSVDELDDFYFRDDRGRARAGGGGDGNGQEDDGGGGGGDGGSESDEGDLPEHVNDGVALVFPVREARAFLAFGSAFSRALGPATLRFHWGGRPVVLEVAAAADAPEEGAGAGTAPAFEAQLVLASLDHKLLAVHDGGE